MELKLYPLKRKLRSMLNTLQRKTELAVVVLSIEPSLLYLLGDPQDPAIVWDKLAAQFQKKTWANKLALRRKLYSLRLKENQSVQLHIKEMTEVFEELSIVGDPIKEEDRVVHLLASLPLGSANKKNVGWIIDSGATCHMCNDVNAFTEYVTLKQSQEISLGDGHIVKATGKGTVLLKIAIGQNQIQRCELKDVLFVPELSYNLLSVSKITKAGKIMKFVSSECAILDGNQRIVATARLLGSLYHLNVIDGREVVNTAVTVSNEVLWHRRYGHVGFRNLEILAANQMVDGFDYQKSSDSKFCEPCIEGKHHRSAFPSTGGKRATEILELIHSDVCGKLDTKSLSGGEYFLTFIDDMSRFAWVYVLKQKSEVFSKFVEWKTMIEKAT